MHDVQVPNIKFCFFVIIFVPLCVSCLLLLSCLSVRMCFRQYHENIQLVYVTVKWIALKWIMLHPKVSFHLYSSSTKNREPWGLVNYERNFWDGLNRKFGSKFKFMRQILFILIEKCIQAMKLRTFVRKFFLIVGISAQKSNYFSFDGLNQLAFLYTLFFIRKCFIRKYILLDWPKP